MTVDHYLELQHKNLQLSAVCGHWLSEYSSVAIVVKFRYVRRIL